MLKKKMSQGVNRRTKTFRLIIGVSLVIGVETSLLEAAHNWVAGI